MERRSRLDIVASVFRQTAHLVITGTSDSRTRTSRNRNFSFLTFILSETSHFTFHRSFRKFQHNRDDASSSRIKTSRRCHGYKCSPACYSSFVLRQRSILKLRRYRLPVRSLSYIFFQSKFAEFKLQFRSFFVFFFGPCHLIFLAIPLLEAIWGALVCSHPMSAIPFFTQTQCFPDRLSYFAL